MGDKADCLLKAILIELKELNNRVVSRSNNSTTLNINTAITTKQIYPASDLLGQGVRVKDIAVIQLGGGFSIALNSEESQTASNDFVVEDEEIHSLTITGSGVAGTGIIRVSGYQKKYSTSG